MGFVRLEEVSPGTIIELNYQYIHRIMYNRELRTRVNKRDVIAVLCEVTFADTSRTVSEAGQKKQKCAYSDHQPSPLIVPVVIETMTT